MTAAATLVASGDAAAGTEPAGPVRGYAAAPMRLTLYDWAPSPFCIKVRALLDHKGLAYRRVPAFSPALWDVIRRGRIGKVPALDIDGKLHVDSTDIAHALERLVPEPRVLPTDPAQRALNDALEDWCDEALYFVGLHHHWIDPEGAPQVPRAFGGGLAGQLGYRFYRRRIARQLRGQGLGRKPAAHIESDLQRAADAMHGLVQRSPFLLGDTPMLCDFALFGQLLYWSRAPKTARVLEARPGLATYMARMAAVREAGRGRSATSAGPEAPATAAS